MPAAPRRLTAPWFKSPLPVGAGLAAGELPTVLAELVLGGRRGGRLGGADLPPPTPVMAD
jgi:hypothetical protein